MASPTINFAPPAPDSDSTVIIAVFVSFGSLFFLAFLLVAVCYFMKWRKKKNTQETDIIRREEHLNVKGAFAPGPHGAQAVAISIEDDIHTDEVIRMNEEYETGLHAKSADNNADALEAVGPSSSRHTQLEHNA
ncbi:hypothetical protein RJ640_026990 [Escallonia rubra]|uniref:Uncharacterized protein n=1 Tax=Escallonia rubra TaxID=112253 RepID=A0AA88U5T9_9ASTE|nr:hypothetical protein RJ640_026990 [Escallonia rubra]